MPLIGGGGAGNIAGGANPTGTGSSLNYIDDFVYAYSGYVSVNNSETSVLKFTTGSALITADIILNYAGTNQAFSEDYAWKVKMNDEIIMGLVMEGAKLESPPQYFPFIIPPYTEMDFTAANITDTDARNMSVLLSGRVYQ